MSYFGYFGDCKSTFLKPQPWSLAWGYGPGTPSTCLILQKLLKGPVGIAFPRWGDAYWLLVGNDTIRWIAYDFLLWLCIVLYHFRDRARCWSKIVIFSCPLRQPATWEKRLRLFSRCFCFTAEPDPGPISEVNKCSHKSFAYSQLKRVTDRQTDRRKSISIAERSLCNTG